MSEAIRRVPVTRIDGASVPSASGEPVAPVDDAVAVEAPLEVRLEGEPFAVIMRTPGADRDLALGFLLTEGVVRVAADVAAVHEGVIADVIDVRLAPARRGAASVWLGTRRQVAMNSACGMCGRRTLESLEIDDPALPQTWTLGPGVAGSLPSRLQSAQATFAETGGLHAAGLFTPAGELVASAEDVGRHNAVDKLLGRMLMAGRLPLDRFALCVSGRSSFEIVQKAFVGGIPVIAAVSAPSSLAVDLADRCGITLLGFVRDGRFNVYTHAGRIARG